MEIDQTIGRWTVIKKVHAARRHSADTGVRARVLCRCVCGVEQTIWVLDLQNNRTTGCASKICQYRFQMAQELRSEFESWLSAYLLKHGQAAQSKKDAVGISDGSSENDIIITGEQKN